MIVIYFIHVKRSIHINSIIWRNWRSSILFGRFNLEACNMCKTFMKKSHSFLINVKWLKTLEIWVVESLQIIFFITFQNNHVNYENLPNHDNLSMIWIYYLKLVCFVFDKLLKFYHIVFLFIFTPNQNLWL